jgi:carboxyl-terminal processing protease
MKKLIFAFAILLFLNSCSKAILGDTPANNPEIVFENFCQQVNDNYSGKDVRPVNWDSLCKIYRPKVTAQTTDSQLIGIFKAMMLAYGDYHFQLNIGNNGINPSYDLAFPNGYIPDFLGLSAVEKGLNKRLTNYKDLYNYEKTADNIGYINIKSFNYSRYPRSDFDYFSTVLETLKDTKGIIIDVRTNGGGDESNAQTVAGHFATSTQLYKYRRTKIGANKTDYTDFLPFNLSPSKSLQYTKPVIVLTNGFTYSNAVSFVMMMRVQSNVTLVGTTTGDGVVGSISRELSNGWLVQIPFGLAYFPDKTVVEGRGIKPKIEVTLSEADRKDGRDALLEKALAILK